MTSNNTGANPDEDDEQDSNANDSMNVLKRRKDLQRYDYSNFITHFENPYTKDVQPVYLHVHDVLNAVLNDQPIKFEDHNTEQEFEIELSMFPSVLKYSRISDGEVVTKNLDKDPIEIDLERAE